MCGIIGTVGRGGETLETLVHGLTKLEYRGYDSAGVALTGEGRGVETCKCEGKIEDLKAKLETCDPTGSVGVGVTVRGTVPEGAEVVR